MPSALAVCRLITNSNLVDCATRQVGGLNALQDLTAVDADLTIHVRNIGPIAHQPNCFDKFALGIGRGNPVMRRERHKLDGPPSEERVGRDQESVGPVAPKRGEGRLDLGTGGGLEERKLQSEGACRSPYLS